MGKVGGEAASWAADVEVPEASPVWVVSFSGGGSA
jgi:hypothetical protein